MRFLFANVRSDALLVNFAISEHKRECQNSAIDHSSRGWRARRVTQMVELVNYGGQEWRRYTQFKAMLGHEILRYRSSLMLATG